MSSIPVHRMELITDPSKLRAKARKVSKWSGMRLAKKLMQFLVYNDISCIGFAAPQAGINDRVFVLRDKAHYAAFVNPRIVEIGPQEREEVEGCLSIPGRLFVVKRPTTIVVKDAIRTKPFELEGISARAWLHELDHLNGKLISDIGVEVNPEDTEKINRVL